MPIKLFHANFFTQDNSDLSGVLINQYIFNVQNQKLEI